MKREAPLCKDCNMEMCFVADSVSKKKAKLFERPAVFELPAVNKNDGTYKVLIAYCVSCGTLSMFKN